MVDRLGFMRLPPYKEMKIPRNNKELVVSYLLKLDPTFFPLCLKEG